MESTSKDKNKKMNKDKEVFKWSSSNDIRHKIKVVTFVRLLDT